MPELKHPATDQVRTRLRAIDDHFDMYRSIVVNFTDTIDPLGLTLNLALVDWWERKIDLPVVLLLNYLRDNQQSLSRVATNIRNGFLYEEGTGFGDIWLTVVDDRYITHSDSNKYYDTRDGSIAKQVPEPIVTTELVNMTGLVYHLYASIAKENNERIPKYRN